MEQKTGLAIDVSKGTALEADLLVKLWEQFNPRVINSYSYNEIYYKGNDEPKPKPKEYEILEWRNSGLNGEIEIYSLKRKFDNEIFTVLDDVECYGKKWKIGRIFIDYADRKGDERTNDLIVNDFGYFKDLKKVKTPILTTTDLVDIYDEEQIVYLLNNYSWKTSERKAKNSLSTNMPIYSSKAARDEYILMNKPMFSLQEINNDYIGDKPFDNLIKFQKLAKSKTKTNE